MGGSLSTNSITSMVDTSIKVINNYEQSCQATPADQQIIVNLNNCKFPDGSSFTADNVAVIDQNCILNATTKTAISSSVKQTMAQIANSTVQQFGFGTVAYANNFIKSALKLADEINNTYYSECIVKHAAQGITINCTDSTLPAFMTLENYQNITQTCVLNAVTKSKAFQDAVNNLQQSAVATQQNTFFYILLGFGIFLAVGAWFLVSIADNTLVQWLIVGLVLFSVVGSVIYAATSQKAGNYPYKKP
jgi:uncharacterized membrane protein